MIRRELGWGLAVSVVASVVAVLWRPETATSPAADVVPTALVNVDAKPLPTASQPNPVTKAADTPRPVARPATQRATSIKVAAASAAPFDPFAGVTAAPPVIPMPVVAPLPQVVPPPAYHFAGRMKTPAGIEEVFLTRGDALVAVKAGTPLDDGYVVESVTADAVLLRHPQLDTEARIPIAPLTEAAGSP